MTQERTPIKVLDLFCGGGGASMGLHLAGFDVTGVDINPQPEYPFEFIQADALSVEIKDFDAIWASPPCQAYSFSTKRMRNKGKEYPDLVAPTRALLESSNLPYIIENVVGAPLKDPIVLCGTMFGLKVFRHRLFESNFPLFVDMQCDHKGHKAMHKRGDGGDFFTVAGKAVGTLAEWQDAMGIEWMTKKCLTQAIPPEYSYYLGIQMREYIYTCR